MSEIDEGHQPAEVLEQPGGGRFAWPEIDRRAFLRRSALTGIAAGRWAPC